MLHLSNANTKSNKIPVKTDLSLVKCQQVCFSDVNHTVVFGHNSVGFMVLSLSRSLSPADSCFPKRTVNLTIKATVKLACSCKSFYL